MMKMRMSKGETLSIDLDEYDPFGHGCSILNEADVPNLPTVPTVPTLLRSRFDRYIKN